MNTTRLGMFETNSSSMHSIVIKKVDKVPFGEKIYNTFLDNYWSEPDDLKKARIYFEDFEDENYCRQDGRILISTEDKLNLYLTMIYRRVSQEAYDKSKKEKIKKNYIKKAFNEKIQTLNSEFFNKLGIELEVEPPRKDPEGSYLLFPDIEDSDFVFDDLLDKLEDYKNLYSFIYCPESFVLLAGDEYDTAYALEKLIKSGIPSDAIVLGHLSYKE